MIDGLLKVAEILLGRRDKLEKADADRRRRVALYFKNVSRCLSDIASALRDGKEPWKACAELDEYDYEYNPWDKKENPVAKVFGKELAREVGSELFRVTMSRGGAIRVLSILKKNRREPWINRRFPEIRGKSPQTVLKESIMNIEQASGKFKALSVLASTRPAKNLRE